MSSKPRSPVLGMIMCVSSLGGCTDRAEPSEPIASVQEQLLTALDTSDEADVIVNFRDTWPDPLLEEAEEHRRAIRTIRATILSSVPEGFTVTRQYDNVPAIAGRVNRVALEALSRIPGVEFIQIDGKGSGALSVAVPAIGGDLAKKNYGVTGKGVRVAVLDTGANATHPDLKSSILTTQHCFTQQACPPSNSAEADVAIDDHGHGSHVAGIITSDGVTAGAGFAPDAEITPIKINDSNDSGQISDWIKGLDWLYTNLSTNKVKLVNMSICSNALYDSQTQCDATERGLATAVKNLVNAGVTLFAASGNMGSATQTSAPACNGGVIAVGATYKSNQGRQPDSGSYSKWGGFGDCTDTTTAFDRVACFTNSGPRLDMLAPGAIITSDSLGTSTEQYRGTSQASPAAVGVAALMLECNPKLTPAQVKDILVRTGVSVTDPKNGRSYPSIRAEAAVKEACGSTGGNSGSAGASAAGGSSASGGTTSVGSGGTTTVANGGSSAGRGGTTTTMGGRTGFGGASSTNGGASVGGLTNNGGATNGGTANGGGANSSGTTNGGSTNGGPASGGVNSNRGGGSGLPSGGASANRGGTVGLGGATAQTAKGGALVLGSGGANAIGGASSMLDTSTDEEVGCSCRAAGASHSVRLSAITSLWLLLGLAGLRRRHVRR